MPIPSGFEHDHYLIVKLKPTKVVRRAIEAMHTVGVATSALKKIKAAATRNLLKDSPLRRLLNRADLQIQPIFQSQSEDESGGVAEASQTRSLVRQRVANLRSSVEEDVEKMYRGVQSIRFPTRKARDTALRELVKDLLVDYVHKPAMRYLQSSVPHDLRNLEFNPRGLGVIKAWEQIGLGEQIDLPDISIAVIDSGIDLGHEDLPDDAIRPFAQSFLPGALANDAIGHGTHVSGIICANSENSDGIAGICNPARLLSLKCFQPFDFSGYYQALRYAIDEQVDVINLSLSGPEGGGNGDTTDLTEKALLEEAVSKGITIVAAMGNSGSSTPEYPAAYSKEIDGLIAVGASTRLDTRWSKSNTGDHLDFLAPGEEILSSWPQHLLPAKIPYLVHSGTSMAVAFVTASVAILKQFFPAATPSQIKQSLINGADKIGGSQFSNEFGHGRLNLARAFGEIQNL